MTSFLARDALAGIGDGLLRRAIALLNLERDLVRAAVLRSAQRADAAGDAGVKVGAGAGDHTGSERRGVELVLGVQHERGVHRANPGVRRRAPVQQRQKMRGHGVGVGLGLDADAFAREVVPVEQHAAERRDEPVGEIARVLRRLIALGLDAAERRDAGAQHVHRVRGVRQRFEHRANLRR